MQNTTVLITGASKGIGAATARHLAALGARVALAARSKPALEALAAEITGAGGTALALECDVARYEQVAQAVADTTATLGAPDVLINNAGLIDPIHRLTDSDPQDWGRVIDVNVKGVYHGLRAVAPQMVAAGRGTIINVSSGAATSALDAWSHYCASKAAVLSLTRCAHVELGPSGVHVVGLSPGTVATDMQRSIRASGLNPVSQLDPGVHIPADWVARAMAYLCQGGAAQHAGTDFSLKSDQGRTLAGLPAL